MNNDLWRSDPAPGSGYRRRSLPNTLVRSLLVLISVVIFWRFSGWALDPGQPPGRNFDLTHWKLTLPDASATSISADDLVNGYTHPAWFYTAADGAMFFFVPVTGGTTSGSDYPRSELRGLIDPDDNSVNWRGYGTHILNAQCRVRQIPSSGKVIIGQIHTYTGAERPMVKIQYNSGTVEGLVKTMPDSDIDLAFLFPNIGLNDLITYQVKMVDGLVSITVNGTTRSTNVFLMNPEWEPQEFYFKAGAYCIDNLGLSSEGAGVSFYHLAVTHSSSSQPSIITQPTNQTVRAGETGRFNVTAAGVAPLNYQWRKNGTNVPSGTSALLSIPGAQMVDAGDYTVVVANTSGSETSAVAVLTVLPPPDTTPPGAVTNLFVSSVTTNSATLIWNAPGDDGYFGTGVSYDLRYSAPLITEANWASATQASGEPAPFAAGNSQAFTINGLSAGVTYYFALKTTDETNNVSPLSNVPSARTRLPPGTLDPSLPPGSNFDMSYWYLKLPDATGSDVSTAQLMAGYSSEWFYTATDGAMVFWCPVTGGIPAGSLSTFSRSELREVLNPANYSVNWRVPGTHILNAQCKVAQVPSTEKVIIGQIHAYSTNKPLVKLQYSGGAIEALVKDSPTADSDDTKYTFADVSLNQTITYQLKMVNGLLTMTVNGQVQTANILASAPAWANHDFYFKAGSYCQDNSGDSSEGARIAFYQLSITHSTSSNTPPSIAGQPANQTVNVGATANFSVTANGTAPLTYRWRRNGTALANATNAQLSLVNVQTNQAGNYTVVVTNSVGSITSSVAVLSVVSGAAGSGTNVLIPTNAIWKYRDNGSDQGTAWREPGFNDSAWASGPAPLGYGDGTEATIVSYGPNASAKYITTYFRRAFTIDNAAASSLIIRLVRDDGAVIYLNGVEIFRSNMPVGGINYLTQASTSGDPDLWVSTNVPAVNLVAGVNVVAVEVHQKSGSSSDIAFNLQFSAVGGSGSPGGGGGGSGDTIAPAAVSNLLVSAVSPNSAMLLWTAPSDHGTSGRAASYDIRYSTSAITESNWPTATQASGEPVPGAADTSQTFTISGLTSGLTYHFALKSSDAATNVSPLSNVPTGRTPLNSSSGNVPPDFIDEIVLGSWDQVSGVTFASDGRMFVWEHAGRVWIVENGVKRSTPFLDISEEVALWSSFGLMGFCLHPDFYNNGYVYLLYIVDSHHLKFFGTSNYSSSSSEDHRATIGRITRYTARASDGFRSVDPASRKILVGESATNGFPIPSQNHGLGSILIAADGTLMAGSGDGANASSTDVGSASGTYFQEALDQGIMRPKENVGSFRSQMLDSLSGKIIRIDPETGDGITNNPFYDAANPRSARSRVWALGLRMPFRMTMRPGTGSPNRADGNPGVLYIGDVGRDTWEDLNVCTGPGMNFGWPAFEGLEVISDYYNANIGNQDALNPLFGTSGCTQRYFYFRDLIKQATLGTPSWPNPCNTSQQIPASLNRFVHARPAIDWKHDSGPARTGIFNGTNAAVINLGAAGSPVSGPQFGGICAVGGVWYTNVQFPAVYRNTYFMADYGGEWIKNFVFDQNNAPVAVRDFAVNAVEIVCLTASPIDGAIYYVSWPSTLRRIRYVPNVNLPPVATASCDRNYGPGPLNVQFNGSNSSDPEGSPLTYRWNFGDGSAPDTNSNPTHTFNAPAGVPTRYDVTLTVIDPGGASNSTVLIISVNNTPPFVRITSPVDGTLYPMNSDTVYNCAAEVSDTEHDASQLRCAWQTVLHHNTHTHIEPIDTNCVTTTVISPIGCDGQTYFWRVTLIVTDAAGLSTTNRVTLYPGCNGIPPEIGWANPADIPYGTALSSNQLNATANVPGTFVYFPAAGTVLQAGTGQVLRTVFTPANSAYQTATSSVPLNVLPVPLEIRADNKTKLFGEALPMLTASYNSFVNGDTAANLQTPPGLNTAAMADSPAGAYAITASGAASPNYTISHVDGTLRIVKATPVLTWTNPAPMAAGTSLSETQLNATANVPGSFLYDPLAGTILFAGTNQQLSVTFTPDDAPNYNTVTGRVTIDVLALPSPPTDLSVTPISSSRIDLDWGDTSDNEDGFKVERSSNGVDFVTIAMLGAGVNIYADIGLPPETTCYYRVASYNRAGSSHSDVAWTRTLPPPPDTTAPAAVTNLTAINITANSLTLAWTAPGDDGNSGTAALFEVRYSSAPIDEANWALTTALSNPPPPGVAGTLQMFAVTGLLPGGTYYFALKTSDETNNLSPLSNIATATTLTNPPPPTGLAATLLNGNAVSLSWIDNANNEDGFKLERSTNGVDFVSIASLPANRSNTIDTTVAPGSTNYYRVRAYNVVGDSDFSNVAEAIVPAPPTGPFEPVLIASNAVWKYLDNGSDQESAWRAPGFGDSTWRSGPAPLGYGDGTEATVVSYGTNASAKYFTTYFRRAFNVNNPGRYARLTIQLVRDDGAVVYLNGFELFRNNMPAGGINYLTPASTSGDPDVWVSTNVSAANLIAGTNVVAVEVHQKSGSSSDIAFNLRLTGSETNGSPSGGTGDSTPPAAISNLTVTATTSNSVTLGWNAPGDDGNSGTATAYDLRYSTAPITGTNWGSTTQVTGEPTPAAVGNPQTLTINGLSGATVYYFALRSSDETNNISPISNVATGRTAGVLSTALPVGWTNRDIGSVGVAGQASHSNGTFIVKGSGADIAGSADAFQFVYQAANGDCDIIARVTAVQNTSSSAKAGVMIREALTANSRYAMMYCRPDNRLYFQRRSSAGGSTSVGSSISASLPRWVRVTRVGSTFTAYYSSNGTSWTRVTSTSITMGANIYIGLAVTSRSNSTLNTSVFDSVTAVP